MIIVVCDRHVVLLCDAMMTNLRRQTQYFFPTRPHYFLFRKFNRMVLIDCGIVMVDGPGMMRESDKLDYLSAQVDYLMRAWRVDDWMDGIFWNEDWDHRAYLLCSEMVEFKTKLRGIHASLNDKVDCRNFEYLQSPSGSPTGEIV